MTNYPLISAVNVLYYAQPQVRRLIIMIKREMYMKRIGFLQARDKFFQRRLNCHCISLLAMKYYL